MPPAATPRRPGGQTTPATTRVVTALALLTARHQIPCTSWQVSHTADDLGIDTTRRVLRELADTGQVVISRNPAQPQRLFYRLADIEAHLKPRATP